VVPGTRTCTSATVLQNHTTIHPIKHQMSRKGPVIFCCCFEAQQTSIALDALKKQSNTVLLVQCTVYIHRYMLLLYWIIPLSFISSYTVNYSHHQPEVLTRLTWSWQCDLKLKSLHNQMNLFYKREVLTIGIHGDVVYPHFCGHTVKMNCVTF
jgi:hypothetical protein